MNSKLSRADPVAMLNKWRVGSTRISINLSAGTVVVRSIVYVSEVTDRHFKLRQALSKDKDSETTGEIIVDMGIVEEYSLSVEDIETPSAITVTALQIDLAGYVTCVLLEYDRDAAIPAYRM